MSISFEHTLDVPAAPTTVFAILDDVERTPEWLTRCVGMEKLSTGPTGVGTRLRYAFRDAGREGVMEGEVTAHEPGRRLTMRFDDSQMTALVDFRVAPAGDGATSLTHAIELTPKTFAGKLFAPLIRRKLPAQTIHAMEALRSLAVPHDHAPAPVPLH